MTRSAAHIVSGDVIVCSVMRGMPLTFRIASMFCTAIGRSMREAHAGLGINEAEWDLGVKHFIESLDNGYDTVIGNNGEKLSGGQRQRLALARAILRDPSILILDEFSNQIDTTSEAEIRAALKEFVTGRTVFQITHKLPVEHADRIVVMDEGMVVDVGTHEELIARCPLYQRLCDPGLARKAA